MKEKSKEDSNNIRVGVIGIGYQGYQAVACMRQQYRFQCLPFKYVAIDDQLSNLNATTIDDLLIIETQSAGNGADALVLIDEATQKKLDHWRAEMDCIFIISALEDDSITALNTAIAGHFYRPDYSMLINIFAEPESESTRLIFQNRISRIKSFSDCIIVNSASQIHQLHEEQQTDIPSWYWPYQYQAVCNISYGIIGSLFHNGLIGIDFTDIKNILRSRSDTKAIYVSAVGEDRAQQAVKQALFLLQQEVWNLTDPQIVAFMSNIIHSGDLSINKYDQIASTLLEDLREDAVCNVGMSIDQTMELGEIGLFVFAGKSAKRKAAA